MAGALAKVMFVPQSLKKETQHNNCTGTNVGRTRSELEKSWLVYTGEASGLVPNLPGGQPSRFSA